MHDLVTRRTAGSASPARLRLHMRLRYLGLAVATIAVGLAVHRGAVPMGNATRDMTGDALWAVMVAWWLGALAPASGSWVRGAAALAIAFAVEFGQLVHTPALDAVRGTTLGRLALGTDFDPRDLLAYSLGAIAATLLDVGVIRRRARERSTPAT